MHDRKNEWITKLASDYAEERAQAGAEIYQAGRERAELAASAWWTNAEFVRLCGERPRLTVGLAVLPATFAKIRAANEWPRLAEVPTDQDASEFELHFAGGVALDVLTTREEGGTGAIANFLKKHGEAIQQVEFRCNDVDQAAEILRQEFGVKAIYPAKRPGADGTKVNFFLVPTADQSKVLIELYESEG